VESEKSVIIVLDIPAGAPAEDAERLLNEPYAEGYNLVNAFPAGNAIRALYRLSAEARKPDTQKEDEEAIAFLKANIQLTTREAYIQLSAKGIKKSQTWIDLKRTELGLPRGRK
jgi:hypothetical protein